MTNDINSKGRGHEIRCPQCDKPKQTCACPSPERVTISPAVVPNNRAVSLEIHFKGRSTSGEEFSDSNRFTEIVGGKEDLTEEQAGRAVTLAAMAWVDGQRRECDYFSAWDDAGMDY